MSEQTNILTGENKNYYPPNIEERIVIYQLHKSGISIRKIAKQIGRSPSTIYRKLKRNSYKTGNNYAFSFYNPAIAHRKYLSNKKKCVRKVISDSIVVEYIKSKIELHWS